MAQTIIFQATGGINKKSTVSITLFDKVDKDRPYTIQIRTNSYDNKQNEYLPSSVDTYYFYDYADALEKYIHTLQWKISFGYSIRSFKDKPITINL